VRAAAKNFQDVLVVVSPVDYGAVLEQLDRAAARRASSASTWHGKRSCTPAATNRHRLDACHDQHG
jgi:AICAR transformylase/IMP cyclohydrolase PurH